MEETIQASEAFFGDVTSGKESRCYAAIALLNRLPVKAYVLLCAIRWTIFAQFEKRQTNSGGETDVVWLTGEFHGGELDPNTNWSVA